MPLFSRDFVPTASQLGTDCFNPQLSNEGGSVLLLVGPAEGWVCPINGPPSIEATQQQDLVRITKDVGPATRPVEPAFRRGDMAMAVRGAPDVRRAMPATLYIEGPYVTLTYSRQTGFSGPGPVTVGAPHYATLAYTGQMDIPALRIAARADGHFERLYLGNLPTEHQNQLQGIIAAEEKALQKRSHTSKVGLPQKGAVNALSNANPVVQVRTGAR